jgi:hypothetical protein
MWNWLWIFWHARAPTLLLGLKFHCSNCHRQSQTFCCREPSTFLVWRNFVENLATIILISGVKFYDRALALKLSNIICWATQYNDFFSCVDLQTIKSFWRTAEPIKYFCKDINGCSRCNKGLCGCQARLHAKKFIQTYCEAFSILCEYRLKIIITWLLL